MNGKDVSDLLDGQWQETTPLLTSDNHPAYEAGATVDGTELDGENMPIYNFKTSVHRSE